MEKNRLGLIIACLVTCLQTLLAQDAQSYRLSQVQLDRRNASAVLDRGYVVLVSIDGFRHDYARMYGAKNIVEIQDLGSSVNSLLPAFPSKTFPNHYTIATGLYPSNHGIVGNSFYSRSKNEWYAIGKPSTLDSSWYSGVPIWTLAESQGMLSASFFWVGSEANIGGFRPTYYYPYDESVPNEFRVQQVIEWLNLSPDIRPHLVLAYFSLVDDAGHQHGPEHEKTKQAVLKIDSLIGQMRLQLSRLDLPIHLALVSDHGMSAISEGMVLPESVDLSDAKVAYGVPTMIYQSDSKKKDELYQQLLGIAGIQSYLKETLPEYLNYDDSDRIGDIVLCTEPPLIIQGREGTVSGGTHGFNPFTSTDMGAIFYIIGPGIKRGLVLPPTENIHIYPFLAYLLGLEIQEPIDGRLDYFKPMLKQ